MGVEKSRWIKSVSDSGHIRATAVQATDLVRELVKRHRLGEEGARGMAECAVSALFVASTCRPGERINLNIRGSGRYKQAFVEAYPDGRIRGYLLEGEPISGMREDIGPWGEGVISILRTRDQKGEQPYIGSIPLVTGHLAKDLTFYWHQSEQVPSAVGIAVTIEEGEIVQAGGFLVQVSEAVPTAEVKKLERKIQDFRGFAESMAADPNPVKLLSEILEDQVFHLIEEKKLRFQCTCSEERVKRALLLLGPEELESMLKEDGQATVQCEFCSTEYSLSAQELGNMAKQSKG